MYVGGGGGLQGMGILSDRSSPFQLGGMALGGFTDAQVGDALNRFPNGAVRIEDGANTGVIRDIVHTGMPVLGTLADVAAAVAMFNQLEATKNQTTLPAGTRVPGSSDPKTQEQVDTLMRIAAPDTSAPLAQYAGYVIYPDGTLTRDWSKVSIPPARVAEIDAHRAQFVFALNTDGIPIQYVAVDAPPAANRNDVVIVGNEVVQRPTGGDWAGFVPGVTNAPPAVATPVVPPVTGDAVRTSIQEATDSSGNIPVPDAGGETAVNWTPPVYQPPVQLPPVPAGGGGGYPVPPSPGPPSGGGEIAVPVSTPPQVINAAQGFDALTPEQKKVAMIGAGILAFILLLKKGK